MFFTTIIHACRRCGSENIRKNGHANNGAQRAKCLKCKRTFTLSPKGPRYSRAFKDQVVAAYQDRMSIRGMTRTFGVCYQSVMGWVGEKIEELPSRNQTSNYRLITTGNRINGLIPSSSAISGLAVLI